MPLLANRLTLSTFRGALGSRAWDGGRAVALPERSGAWRPEGEAVSLFRAAAALDDCPTRENAIDVMLEGYGTVPTPVREVAVATSVRRCEDFRDRVVARAVEAARERENAVDATPPTFWP